MAKTSISESIAPLAETIAEEAGCELVDVEFVKEGTSRILRVYIDKDDGISIDDCESVSRALSQKLDELDPIPYEYCLEVSSPGDRAFKKPRDFEKAIGKPVEVILFKAIDNIKRFEGDLISYDGESIAIKNETNVQNTFRIEQIAKVKKVFKL